MTKASSRFVREGSQIKSTAFCLGGGVLGVFTKCSQEVNKKTPRGKEELKLSLDVQEIMSSQQWEEAGAE